MSVANNVIEVVTSSESCVKACTSVEDNRIEPSVVVSNVVEPFIEYKTSDTPSLWSFRVVTSDDEHVRPCAVSSSVVSVRGVESVVSGSVNCGDRVNDVEANTLLCRSSVASEMPTVYFCSSTFASPRTDAQISDVSLGERDCEPLSHSNKTFEGR